MFGKLRLIIGEEKILGGSVDEVFIPNRVLHSVKIFSPLRRTGCMSTLEGKVCEVFADTWHRDPSRRIHRIGGLYLLRNLAGSLLFLV